MDACRDCPYHDQCIEDPEYPCFLNSPDDAEYWKRIGRSDG